MYSLSFVEVEPFDSLGIGFQVPGYEISANPET
jgi:hypothetical protein